MKPSILIVDDSDIMLKLISAALKGDGYQLMLAGSGSQALELIKHTPPDMAILDVVLPDIDGYAICKALRANPVTSKIPIIMLTGLTDIENRMKAFDAGADDFMPKPFQMEELQIRVQKKLNWIPAAAAASPFVNDLPLQKTAVFSLRGGVGVSTLSVNLAIGLSRIWNAATLLLDLALLSGQDALMMNLSLRNTWADLAKAKPDEIDTSLLDQVLLHHQAGVDVMAAPRRSEEAELVTDKHVQRVVELAQQKYRYLVFDLPHDFSFTTIKALDLADTILLLTAPDLASMHSAANAMAVFKDLGYPSEKIQLVLNWNIGTSGLARKEIEKVLQKPVSVVIPNMPNSLVTAITLGKPIILETEKPEAALFEDLAYFWTTDKSIEKSTPAPSPTWQKIMDRKQQRLQQSQKK